MDIVRRTLLLVTIGTLRLKPSACICLFTAHIFQITFEINIHHINCLEAICLGMYYHTLTSMN